MRLTIKLLSAFIISTVACTATVQSAKAQVDPNGVYLLKNQFRGDGEYLEATSLPACTKVLTSDRDT